MSVAANRIADPACGTDGNFFAAHEYVKRNSDLGRDPILARDRDSLDLFWLHDEILQDSAGLSQPHLRTQETTDDLRSPLGQIEDPLGDVEQQAAHEPQ